MKIQVLYAAKNDGIELPVIDITNRAFAVTLTDAEIATMADRYASELAQQVAMTSAIEDALQTSRIGRALRDARGGYLAGLPTYVLKLGPENLGAEETSPIDRHIASSFPALLLRMRVGDMAELLAKGLADAARSDERRPMCLLNIAGGPAADSWNALILLRAEEGDLLKGREVLIAVLELDEGGPTFGARAVAALSTTDGPLRGLDVQLRHFHYQWSDTQRLQQLLDELQARSAACAISSEGGLFEYGSDEEVVSNLAVLQAGTAKDAVVVGSVTRESKLMRAWQAAHGMAIRPRTMEAFESLADEAGWRLQGVIERPLSFHVSLVKSRIPA